MKKSFCPNDTIGPILDAIDLNRQIEDDFNITKEARALCDTYYLLHYSGAQFGSLLNRNGHSITREGILYRINWLGEHHKAQCINAERVGVSFRRKHGEKTGIVIPKVMVNLPAPVDRSRSYG